jgi:hypothetical protein
MVVGPLYFWRVQAGAEGRGLVLQAIFWGAAADFSLTVAR